MKNEVNKSDVSRRKTRTKRTYKVKDIADKLGWSLSYCYRKIKQNNIKLPKTIPKKIFDEITDTLANENKLPNTVVQKVVKIKEFEQISSSKNKDFSKDDLIEDLESDYSNLRQIQKKYIDIKNDISNTNDDIKLYKIVCDEIRKTQQSINSVIKALDDLKFSKREDVPAFEELDEFLK